jgi:16S rRNA (uracil1498-N3)-methyltransferase
MTRRRWIADQFNATSASLTGTQAGHLIRVLRVKPGMQYDIVAGDRVHRGTVEEVADDRVIFALHEEVESDIAIPVTLVLAVFKFDRLEWAIEKATELGVAAIVPVIARRTEKYLAQSAEKRVERWRRIAHEAAQQSRRSQVPPIPDPQTLGHFLAAETSATNRVVLAETERVTMLQDCLRDNEAQTELAVGPEGGWTEEELSAFKEKGWQAASLGPRILRAETAAIASIAIAAANLEFSS